MEMSLLFAEESLMAIRPEIELLIERHWEEVCDDPTIPLDIHWERYEEIEAAGLFKTVTARENTELVGYIGFVLLNLLHYKQIYAAHDDMFYLHPDHRKGLAAIKMFRFAEDLLRSYGVDRILYHSKHKAPASGRIFEFLGYRPIETIWSADLRTK